MKRINTYDTLGVITATVASMERPSAADVLYFGREYVWDRYNLAQEYALDTAGQRTGLVGDYRYDFINRMDSAWVNVVGGPPELLTWEFDENSNWLNRTKADSTGLTISESKDFDYDSNTNRLNYSVVGADTIFYKWNAKGELTSRRKTAAPITVANRGSLIDSMSYDHRGLLIQRTTNYNDGDYQDTLTGAGYLITTENAYNISGQKVRQMYTYHVPMGDCGGGGGGTQSATSGGGYLATGLSPFGGGGTTSSVIDPGEDPGLPPPPPPQSDTCIYDSIFQTTYYVYSGGELVNHTLNQWVQGSNP